MLVFVIGFLSTSKCLEHPSGMQPRLHKLPDDYWYVPALSDDEKVEFKKLINAITDDVLNGKNENEAEKVFNSNSRIKMFVNDFCYSS